MLSEKLTYLKIRIERIESLEMKRKHCQMLLDYGTPTDEKSRRLLFEIFDRTRSEIKEEFDLLKESVAEM